jgi:hypothetical protein
MWGGNVYSALAGMIGNAWGFVFFVLAFGRLIRAHRDRSFSIVALCLGLLAALSHFYALLMLLVLGVALGLYDCVQFLTHRDRPPWGVYLTGLFLVLLMCWWLLPLLRYSSYSSDLAGNWNIDLLKTYTKAEKIGFVLSLVLGLWVVIRTRFRHSVYAAAFLFLGIFIFMFYFNFIFNANVGAFSDVRLWPSIYFGVYLFLILAVETLYASLPRVLFPLVLAGLYFFIPAQEGFSKAKAWMRWNYQGIEASKGWKELQAALKLIENEPVSRISYELKGAQSDRSFGSVRAMELIPYLSHHEIVVGGIVNSASYAGIGYFEQCLMGDECAGLPPGTYVPEKDFSRGIDMMRALGIQYHIAISTGNRETLDRNGDFQKLYGGSFLALYKLKGQVSPVEVYSGPLPVYYSANYLTTLLNLPRWDVMRNAGIVFLPSLQEALRTSLPILAPETFINFLDGEWNAKRRVLDRFWKNRRDRIQNKINLFIFFRNNTFDPATMDRDGAEFVIADRSFDPNLFVLNAKDRYSEVGVPLIRSQPGRSTVHVAGAGYQVFVDQRPIPMNASSTIEFKSDRWGASSSPVTWVVAKPQAKFRHIELSSVDPELETGFGGSGAVPLTERITGACQPRLERGFDRMILHTQCPGKPHIIKYNYYPKWKSDVPIYVATHGYMALTPLKETTVLRHCQGWADVIGKGLTALGLLFTGWFYRSVRARKLGGPPHSLSYSLLARRSKIS